MNLIKKMPDTLKEEFKNFIKTKKLKTTGDIILLPIQIGKFLYVLIKFNRTNNEVEIFIFRTTYIMDQHISNMRKQFYQKNIRVNLMKMRIFTILKEPNS